MPVAELALAAAGTGLVSLVAGHVLGSRQRRTSLVDLETQIAERLMTRLDRELADALAEVTKLRDEVQELRRRLELLGEREAQLQRDLGEARAERDRLQLELAAAAAAVAAKDQEISDLRALLMPAAPS